MRRPPKTAVNLVDFFLQKATMKGDISIEMDKDKPARDTNEKRVGRNLQTAGFTKIPKDKCIPCVKIVMTNPTKIMR